MSNQEHTTSVEYREVSGFLGYRVGNDGSVWSQRIPRWGWKDTNPWRQLKPEIAVGYHRVCLYSGVGESTRRFVHQLVLETFVGLCPEGMLCRHLNGVRTDNRIENLAWGTYEENEKDKVRHGTSLQGERNFNAKITDAAVLEICELRSSGQTLDAIGARYDLTAATVSSILLGKTWRHLARDTYERHIHCGTVNRGDSHGMSKLTSDQVIEIRRLRAPGMTLKTIAVDYDITMTSVSNIVRGKTWRHLLPETN